MNHNTVYRIHTEGTNLAETRAILDERFDGYTMFEGDGRYKGKGEPALIIEVWSEGDALFTAVQSAANAIKTANAQQVVCVTVQRATFLQF